MNTPSPAPDSGPAPAAEPASMPAQPQTKARRPMSKLEKAALGIALVCCATIFTLMPMAWASHRQREARLRAARIQEGLRLNEEMYESAMRNYGTGGGSSSMNPKDCPWDGRPR